MISDQEIRRAVSSLPLRPARGSHRAGTDTRQELLQEYLDRIVALNFAHSTFLQKRRVIGHLMNAYPPCPSSA